MSSDKKAKYSEEDTHVLLTEYLATKNVDVRDKIVLQYKNLVESISRRFAGSGEPLEDLIQEGYIGLITAADLYDIEKGVKFSTYATHFIIGQIKHSLRDRGKIIKEPAWIQELNHRMSRVIDSLYQELGRQPTESEIAKIMHVPEEMVVDLLTTREVFKVASLDSDEHSLAGPDVDNVKDEKYTAFHLPVEDKIVLETAVNKLKLIEQKVINDFYYTGLTQTEIAKKLGISCNYVSHILRSGTKKLRRILSTEELAEVQMQLQLAGRRAEMAAQTDLSVLDNLTGLYNLAYLENRLDEEIIRSSRNKTELALVILQVQGLEEFGRKVGAMRRDDIFCAMARVLKDSMRRCDLAGRIDDWQFAVIMPYTGPLVEKACQRLENAIQKVKPESHSFMQFSVQSAYVLCSKNGSRAKTLFAAAQKALERKVSIHERKAA